MWLFLSTALVIPASLLVFLPINETVGMVVAAVLYLGCVGLLLIAAPAVEVTSTEFVAGKARVPLELVASAAGFVGSEASAERGQRLDARAWLLIRGWIDPVVRVELNDPNDPVPYWLVSTRRPDDLIEALDAAKKRRN